MKEVIGFAGRAESGKSTAAEMLHDIAKSERGRHIEFSEPILELAQKWMVNLKSNTRSHALAALQTVGRTGVFDSLIGAEYNMSLLDNYLNSRPQLQPEITVETKSQHRPLLEWLGKGVVDHVSPTFWSDMVCQKVTTSIEDGADLITLGGIRSMNDASAARSVGGVIVRVSRENHDQLLPTEASINAWEPDFYVDNNGSLTDLSLAMEDVWMHIKQAGAFGV